MAPTDLDSDDEEKPCKEKCKEWCFETFVPIQAIQAITILFLIIVLWAIGLSIWEEKCNVFSDPFALLVLFTTAKALGMLFQLCKIPSIIGEIVMGMILKNVRFLQLSKFYLKVSGYLRKLTLLSILLPAAFSIDPTIMRQMFALIVTLATIPTIVEILVVCILSNLLLSLPWMWSLLNGFIMGGTAPAIIIPCLFALEAKGYGNVNGVQTLATAACILNVIETVTLFGLIYGFLTVKSDNALKSASQGPLELVIGTAFGIVYGIVAAFIPHESDYYVVTLRTIMISFGSLLSFFGSYAIGYPGAGVLGCFMLAFVANFRWRNRGWYRHNPVRENFKLAWKFFEPISFSLIGMEIDFQKLLMKDLALGSVVMVAGALAHFSAALLSLKIFKTYTWGQIVFIGIGTAAKATVQAALGPMALDFARGTEAEHQIVAYAQSLLAVSIVSIMVTSPLCTILLLNLGPKLIPQGGTDPDTAFTASRLALLTAPDQKYRDEHNRISRNWLRRD